MVPYQQAWDLQVQISDQIAAGEIPSTLLLLEHPHTITFGRRGKQSNLLWAEAELEQRGVQVYWVDRGGDVTYHGPGQLVGYPLIRLNATSLVDTDMDMGGDIPKADYIGYLRMLEQVLINSLETFGIQGERLKDLTGVWVKRSKIAAIGVKVDARGITRHGFALNVSTDLSFFEMIVPCGIVGKGVTSMEKLLGRAPSLEDVARTYGRVFGETLDRSVGWVLPDQVWQLAGTA